MPRELPMDSNTQDELYNLADAYSRLRTNKDFKQIIVKGILEDEAVRCAGSFSGTEDELNTLKTINYLTNYFNSLDVLVDSIKTKG